VQDYLSNFFKSKYFLCNSMLLLIELILSVLLIAFIE
jgi:hypothetical protein